MEQWLWPQERLQQSDEWKPDAVAPFDMSEFVRQDVVDLGVTQGRELASWDANLGETYHQRAADVGALGQRDMRQAESYAHSFDTLKQALIANERTAP